MQDASNSHYQLIERAIQWIADEHRRLHGGQRHREPSLGELAGHLGLSDGHLQKVFSSWAGISPKQFFQVLQRDHAVALLRRGQSTLQSSFELGLGSNSQLHNLMLRLEALTPGQIQQQGRGQTFFVGLAETPLGHVFVGQTRLGLHSLEFETPTLNYQTWQSHLRRLNPLGDFVEDHQQAKQLARLLFDSSAAQPLHLIVRASPFQIQVWEALLHLPPAQLTSYKQLAQTIGKPNASRAVGSAVASNPIAYLIPCHRVIQSTGHLGQYRWSPIRKMALHAWETAQIQYTCDHSSQSTDLNL
ncbi:MAG TPA: bifunctional helix-turn-helix domain-containing protein/methylated-DNA--[protein]-cysteine S-methyltransferase [Limnobacter sp.]|nr:bifunctional helix-turn-helix domain-containing protein/methylated-DNA--[protein]-cysteine S-methyltransferase [Limnobacter sp.]